MDVLGQKQVIGNTIVHCHVCKLDVCVVILVKDVILEITYAKYCGNMNKEL